MRGRDTYTHTAPGDALTLITRGGVLTLHMQVHGMLLAHPALLTIVWVYRVSSSTFERRVYAATNSQPAAPR